MKNTMSRAIWGILFVFIGLGLAGKAVGLFEFNIFFPGWWTLFIIIPSAVGLANSNDRISSMIGLAIGLILFFFSRGFFSWYTTSRLFIPFILIAIGIHIIQKGLNNKSDKDYYRTYSNMNQSSSRHSTNHGGSREFNGILSGRNIQFVDEIFHGAIMNSILGNIQLDLRNAKFEKDTVIDITCILGGVDIYVPSNVKVAVNCTPILGGVDNVVITPIDADQNTYTIFINGTCILGGIEVK